MNAVDVQNLTHVFKSVKKSIPDRIALNAINLNAKGGEISGLLGPNGGGKTTLFRILSTYLSPAQGKAFILGEDVAKNPDSVRRKIGVVFQHPSLDKKLTLRENMIHQGHLYGLRGDFLKKRINELAESLQLMDRLDDMVESLSGGLQRRGEIAKGLLHKPDVLLLDEPSTGLDPGARLFLWDILMDLKKSGVTILLTTHLMEEAEKCDRLILLHQGQVVVRGTPSELKSRIGGDVITIETTAPAELIEKIKHKFGGIALNLDGVVRIEKENGHQFIPQLVEALPKLIQSIKVGKPTLEDVFARETGHSFWNSIKEVKGHE